MEEEQSRKKIELSKFLNNKIQNTAVLSVLRFRKTVGNKTTKPEVNDALQFISKIDEKWSGKFHRNFQTKEITFRKSKNYLFFALIEKDPKNLIEELCRVITTNNDKNTGFEFTQAHRNLWNNEGSTELEFHNIPDWSTEGEALEFYRLFGEVADLKSYGGCDVVRFHKINTYLVLRWHSQDLSNKKTGIFKVDDDYSITAKFTSKVQCGTCCGYGHQAAACPEGVLPLLEKLKKSKPSSKESKVAQDMVDNANAISTQEVRTSPKMNLIGLQVEKTTQNNNKSITRPKETATKEKKTKNKAKEQKKENEPKKMKSNEIGKEKNEKVEQKQRKARTTGQKNSIFERDDYDDDDEEYEEGSHLVDSDEY